MASGNEHMARGNELMEEIRREHELNRAAFAENAMVMSRLSEVLERFDQTQLRMQATLDGLRAEVRAQTEAIFKLIDRFENGGTGPAPA